MSTDSNEPTRMLILHIEVPDIWADNLTPEWCQEHFGDEYDPDSLFAEQFDENVFLSMLVRSMGEDPDGMIGREGRIVGFDTRLLRPSERRASS